MKSSKISFLSRLMVILAALLLVISVFVPIWRIDLTAPQYPEGLMLQIYADKLGGNVDVINGLNHYIGMKTLHADDFIEFTILPYIIGAIAVFFIVSALIGTKRWLYAALILLVLFGIVAMIDFWIWEYNYGHNLDPGAPIIVPGMAYQPPLIGFKQLLNFGAFSMPDLGGWLFVAAGALLVLATFNEAGGLKIFNKKSPTSVIVTCLMPLLFLGCSEPGPEPVVLNSDRCENCRMVISDGKFAAEIITRKGRIFKFDDLRCMQAYVKEKANQRILSFLVNDFEAQNDLTDVSKIWFVTHEDLRSPMGGNTAAFISKEAAEKLAAKYHVKTMSWEDMNK